MAIRVCIGNRQGGVGKSTVTMMLAHTLAFLGGKRVLVIDLDTQCNSSFALVGNARLRTALEDKATLSDYMGRRMRGRPVRPTSFVIENVGDVGREGHPTNVALMPSSVDLDEDIQDAIIETRLVNPFNSMNILFKELLAGLDEHYDYILMDCPPGLSPLVNAAIHLGDRVIVPFRPDYISQYALDRMADKIERTGKYGITRRRLADIPHAARKYVSVVNMHGGTASENRMLEDFDGIHPRCKTQLRRQPDVAESFYWQEDLQSLKEKYGKAEPQVRQLYKELVEWMSTIGDTEAPVATPRGRSASKSSLRV